MEEGVKGRTMPIDKALEDAQNMAEALCDLYGRLCSVRAKRDATALTNEAEGLCEQVKAMCKNMEHLIQGIAFAKAHADEENMQ